MVKGIIIMKIEIPQSKLAKALNNVSRVAMGARATLPILSNVLIRVGEKEVTLTTTNLDMMVVDYLEVSKSEEGAITVPARLIADFVSNLPRSETVEIATEENRVIIQAGEYNSVINGASASEYPDLPGFDEEKMVKFELPATDFKEGLSQVMVAASNDMARPALTGVYFNTSEGSLYVAATDGYRLAERKLVEKVEAEVVAIVPAVSLQEVLRSLDDKVEKIEVLFDETQVRFRLGEVEVTSKLVDGSFPDYRQLIPKETDIKIELKRDELTRITKLAALFAKEAGGSIVCRTVADAEIFSVASVANEFGENNSDIKVKVEKDGRITLNSRFLLDALNAVGGTEIEFGFSNKLDPVVLRAKDVENYVHIVMPLKG